MIAVDPQLDRTWDCARALVGGRIESIRLVGGGRNSRVFRVETAERTYALKQYPSRDDDPRDRLGAEAAALELMERHGIERVPRMLAVDPQRRAALLSWLHGAAVTAVEETDIDAAAAFLAALHALRGTGDFAPDHFASEACLSGAEIVRQIEARLSRLRQLPAAETDLQVFLDRAFAPALGKIMRRIGRLSAETGINVDATLPSGNRSLVPSDFGFHNSLRADDGSLVFFDFEYFGWDDPVKVTADFMLHPGTPLTTGLRRRFRVAAQQLYGEDPWYRQRLAAYYPLFGLRWVLILLNDFTPNRWRPASAEATESWESAKQRQLSRARELLARVSSEHHGSGHGE